MSWPPWPGSVKTSIWGQMMGETRKSDFVGDVYGEWTVVRKGEPIGDRKRRWVVSNGQTEMEVLQTDLADLKLAKTLKDKAEATDAARLTLPEAEADLYNRLDAQIAEANPFAVKLTDPDLIGWEHPFDLTLPDEDGHCVDCEDGNHPDLVPGINVVDNGDGTVAIDVADYADLLVEIAAKISDLVSLLADSLGNLASTLREDASGDAQIVEPGSAADFEHLV